MLILDTSRWEKDIVWEKVSPRPDLVIMKATQGIDIVDGAFHNHKAQLIDLGIPWGVFHFLECTKLATPQVEFFMDVTKGDVGNWGAYWDIHTPAILDFEPTDFTNTYDARQKTNSWLTQISQRTNRTPMVYTSRYYWSMLDDVFGRPPSWSKDYLLWVAWYSKTATEIPPSRMPKGWDNWLLWQYATDYTSPGLVDRYGRPYGVDINRPRKEPDMPNSVIINALDKIDIANREIADQVLVIRSELGGEPPIEPPPSGFEPYQAVVVNAASGLRVRDEPSVGGEVVGGLQNGEVVTVYEEISNSGNLWARLTDDAQPEHDYAAIKYAGTEYLKKV